MSFSFIWDEYVVVDITGRWLNCGKGVAKRRVAGENLTVG
jgi:hypothetical protein